MSCRNNVILLNKTYAFLEGKKNNQSRPFTDCCYQPLHAGSRAEVAGWPEGCGFMRGLGVAGGPPNTGMGSGEGLGKGRPFGFCPVASPGPVEPLELQRRPKLGFQTEDPS